MAMKKSVAAASPEAYVEALSGWQKVMVQRLRRATLRAGVLEERIKWRHLVYFSNGPVLLIRAEDTRVLLGFWRGQRLRGLEPRLVAGGKYEMATAVLREGDDLATARVTELVKAAIALNGELGEWR